jgi:hypothetical protein
MAGPAPKELQQFCTGCSQHLKAYAPYGSISAPIGTGVSSSIIPYIAITGSGRGALSGVTGFYLGYMAVNSLRSLTGNCTAVTGSLTFTGSTGLTGLTGWKAQGITGCTGASPCISNLAVSFSANPNIWNYAPYATVTIQVQDYNYGNVYFAGALTSGNQSFSGNINTNVPVSCGTSIGANLTYSLRIPGYSGQVENSVMLETICKPCLLG